MRFFSCFLLLLENVDEATCIFLCIGELVGVAVWVGSVGKKEARMALQTELNYRTNQGQMSIAEHFSFLFLTLLHFYCRVFILLCFFFVLILMSRVSSWYFVSFLYGFTNSFFSNKQIIYFPSLVFDYHSSLSDQSFMILVLMCWGSILLRIDFLYHSSFDGVCTSILSFRFFYPNSFFRSYSNCITSIW